MLVGQGVVPTDVAGVVGDVGFVVVVRRLGQSGTFVGAGVAVGGRVLVVRNVVREVEEERVALPGVIVHEGRRFVLEHVGLVVVGGRGLQSVAGGNYATGC